MIIAIDFDGTIAKTRYPEIVSLMTEAAYIAKWRSMGHKVILWTCRTGEPLQMAIQFCASHGLVIDSINENLPDTIMLYGGDTRKISADIYIDDKCPMPIEEQWHAVNQMLGGSTRRTVNANIIARNKARKG